MTQNGLKELIEKSGAKYSASISTATTHLIVADLSAKKDSKVKQAEKRGDINIVGKEYLQKFKQ